jgi:hypothetical protein
LEAGVIVTKDLSVDLREQDAFGQDCVVFEIAGQSGNSVHARWERDANRFQVAAALERLATALRRTEI